MANPAQFEQVIAALMSPENNVRKQAEAVFEDAKKQPDLLVQSLSQVLTTSQSEQIRSLGSILLRRLIGKGSEALWDKLSPQVQEVVKNVLSQVLELEKSLKVRTNIADCISHLAENILEKGQWNELLPFMFKCTKSPEENIRECALHIFGYLATCIGDKFRPYFNVLKEVLTAGLNDPSLKVRIEALSATANFLQVLSQPEERANFQQLTPMMLECVSACLNAKNEEEAQAALEVFVDLAELDPVFLKPNLNMVIQAMLTISQHPGLEDGTKNLALEFLITLAEQKGTMARKFPQFVELVVPIVLNMMLQVEEDDDWNNPENEEEDDEIDIENSAIGEENLDRLSLALGGKAVIPVLFAVLQQQFMTNPDWRYRYAALMAVSIVGEGAIKYLLPNLPDVVKLVLPFFADPHPRVRWAACNTIGQMSTDFGPEFQSMFHSQVLPSLVIVMDDAQNPRVQSHAASAVINFCEHATPDILKPYLEGLLGKLYILMGSGKTIVQEQTITAIAAIADCAQVEFAKYYDTFIPILKQILANAHGKAFRMLRGKAMECVSIIGVAVGKEKFHRDATEIMQLLMGTQSMKLEADDPQISFLLQSWARICRCLGPDFVPFLPHVMPSLIQSAKISPDVTVGDQGGEEEEDGWEFIPVGDKRIGIHTSGLEEKSTACNMLYCYASELKEGFFPYVEEVAKLLVPFMIFYYHDGVRTAAVSTMPHLLASAVLYFKKSDAAKGADTTYIRHLFSFMLPSFLESLNDEMDLEILVSTMGSFIETLGVLGIENQLTQEQMDQIVKVVMQLLSDVDERRKERLERKGEEDHDEEEEERIEDEAERDEEIVSGLGEIIGHLARYNKGTFLPIFNQKILPIISEFLKPTGKSSDRQTALCVLDDIIEHCGADAYQYYQHFIPAAMAYSTDGDPAARQASLFGLGVVAQMGGEQIAPAIPEILARLTHAITLPGVREDIFTVPTENAISSVGKILLYQSKVIQFEQVLNAYLSWLPVTKDAVESKVIYKQLCTFAESSNAVLLGENLKNLPKLLTIFADILDTNLVDEEITKRIGNLLRGLQASVPGHILSQCWSALTGLQQQKLQRAVASQ